MKIKKNLFVTFISIFLSFSLFSQHTLCGKVINQKGEPLYPANIKIKNSSAGTSTESDGSFCINIPAKGEIRISFLGYETVTLRTSSSDTAKISFKTIVLTAKDLLLAEFEVNAKYLIPVTKEKNIYIRDYEFMENNILTLSIRDNERKLSLISLEDSLIWETNVSGGMFRCTKFYKDFLSNTYLLSDDSVFQITNKDQEIYFFPGIAIADFNKVIVPSLAMCDHKIVYRVYGPYHKSVYYFLIKEGKKRLLFSTKDAESEMYVNDIFNKIKSNPSPPFAKYEGKMRVVTDYFNYDYFKKILVQPIEIHLVKIEDNIYIFDHFGAKMQVYDCNAKLLNTKLLYYPKRKDFVSNQLLAAKNQKDVYAVFNKDGLYTIQQIDLESGKLKGSETKITYPYVEKMSVLNHQVYFLYKQSKDDASKILYKMDL